MQIGFLVHLCLFDSRLAYCNILVKIKNIHLNVRTAVEIFIKEVPVLKNREFVARW